MNDTQARDVITEALGAIAPEADLATVPGEADLRRELDLDSLDFLNFIVAVDAATGVHIPEGDYPKLTTLDGCISYLRVKAH